MGHEFTAFEEEKGTEDTEKCKQRRHEGTEVTRRRRDCSVTCVACGAALCAARIELPPKGGSHEHFSKQFRWLPPLGGSPIRPARRRRAGHRPPVLFRAEYQGRAM